jgi:aspartyl-tRNA(Asn)/glutamyl-tRNA(Gln) amidotransferase subunit A
VSDLIRLSAAELGERLASGDVSSVEATQAHLDRIAAVDGVVHAFLHVDGERALATAADIDRRRDAGEQLGALTGVPIAIKDVLVTEGMPSTAGSRILEGWIPPYDATPVRLVREAGMVPLGKTNMDEFAMGSSTRGTSSGSPAAPAAAPRHPSRASRRRSRSAATPAARSASPRTSPAPSASSPPTGP